SYELEGTYRLLFDANYTSNSVNSSCKTNYESIINSTLNSVGNDITSSLCRINSLNPLSGRGKLVGLVIDEAQNQVRVKYEVSLDRRPGTDYSICADTTELYLQNANKYNISNSISTFRPSQCATLTLQGNGLTLDQKGYFCPDANRNPTTVTYNSGSKAGICLKCPIGTYKSPVATCVKCPVGTYSLGDDSPSCMMCPSGTSTYQEGASNIEECISECGAGSFNAETGLPPCASCPQNTTRVNSTTCLACPGNQITKAPRANSSDECVDICPPGYFNEYDGYSPCRKCPFHTYSDTSGTKRCTPCSVNQYTEADGSTNTSDCLDLSNSDECSSRCVNGMCINNQHSQSCQCYSGWSGENCTVPFDPCNSVPCRNGGNCTSVGINFQCACPAGTSGEQCEVIIPTCMDDTCFNNGMCENLLGRPKCHCHPGFSGPRCNISEDLCSNQPCGPNGQCVAHDNLRYSCTCQSGYTGKNCEKPQDQCFSNPCQNDGVCQTSGPEKNTCNCSTTPGYNGTLCEKRILQCDNPARCGTGSWCVEHEEQDSYICVCPPQSQYLDPTGSRNQTCELKNFCESKPCLNGGTCRNGSTTFTCSCPPGYDGSRCQHDIDSCASSPCQNGGVCNDLLDGYNCSCTGYTGVNCENEIDECLSHNCSKLGTEKCIEKVNGFECQCKTGYSGDYCQTDINDCASSPCLHEGKCVDSVGDYKCDCLEGWLGKNCEVEVKYCTSNPCANGAQCENLFNDFFCRCKLNTFGANCSNSVKICNVANPCVHGSCKDDGGNVTCACPENYVGDRCEETINPCSSTSGVCKNEAVCEPSLDNYECKCQPGYAGPQCDLNPSNCGLVKCLPPATCIDLLDKAVCRCPLGKEGPLCAYDTNSNFDLLFRHSDKTSMAAVEYPIQLSKSSFSISMWIQFTEKSDTGVFLSIFTVPSPNSLQGKKPLLSMNETTLHYYDPVSGQEYLVPQPIQAINMGSWHYLVVNVDGGAGRLTFIADTVQGQAVIIPKRTFDLNLWVVLGCEYDVNVEEPAVGKGFHGKLSRVTVFERTLKFGEEVTNVGNTDVSALFPDSILRWGLEFSLMGGVQRITPSLADTPRVSGTTKVTISAGQCPANILKYSSDRLTSVKYEVPQFTGQDDVKTSLSQEDVYVWGRYPVVVEASNKDGNKGLCLFNIYVQNDQCTIPPKPPKANNLLCLPDTRATYTKEGYQQCGINCEAGFAPSIPGPHLHTCGPSGNWDPENKFVPYRLSPCGSVRKPNQNLVVVIRYRVPTTEFEPVKFRLEAQIRETQVNLNTRWNQVCSQTDCSDSSISIERANMRRKRQATVTGPLELVATLILPNTQGTVTNSSNPQQNISVEALYNSLLLAETNNVFDYSAFVSGALPYDHTVTVEDKCDEPQVLISQQCVDCGPGTFFNNATKECDFCPAGTYQTLEGQTSCVPCSGTSTTQYYGSYDSSDCKEKCSSGQYFDTKSDKCENCSLGFYQPDSGQFYCLACDAGKTTKFTGTKLSSNCTNGCPSGQEIGPTNDCVNCTIGFYRGINDTLCQRCPSGMVTRNMGSKSIADCDVADNPPGTYRNQTDPSKSIPCPVDEYQPERWQFECLPCQQGFRAESEGAKLETDCKFFCPAGQQVKVSENSCESCPQGTYKDETQIFELCGSCPSNYTTVSTGATSKDNCTLFRCQAGSKPKATQPGCDLCPRGQYQELANQDDCDSCPDGYSTRQEGSTKQTSCETFCQPGQEKFNGTCVKCQIGFFKNNDQDVFSPCIPCLNTKYVTESIGAISNDNCTVLNCSEGYKANMATEQCEVCPRGSYQDKKYQVTCIRCTEVEYTRTNASTSKSDCESYCEPGYEKVGSECKMCRRGFFKNNDNDPFMACTQCPDGYVTPAGLPATYSSNCTVPDCKPGTYILNGACEPCPKGQWQNESWSESCNNCPFDKDTSGTGADSIDRCLLNCPAGKQNTPGTDICEQCPMGYYKDTPGPTDCTACADFSKNNIRISPAPGADNVAQCTKLVCLPGFYPNGAVCTRCTYGSYQPYKWRDTCEVCLFGETTYKLGATNETECEPNCTAGQGLVDGQCKICSVREYNDKSDPTKRDCSECAPGFITGREGATSRSECSIKDCSAPGTFRNATSNTCENCPVGEYQDMPRQDSCQSCQEGYTTRYVGSSSSDNCLKDCPAGQQHNNVTDQCERCPKGSYRSKTPGEDSWTCQLCTDEMTTASDGADQMADCNIPSCSVGFGYDQAQKKCVECPANTFQDLSGQYLPCKSCSANQVTAGTGTVSSTGCSFPCSSGTLCAITTQVCVDDANSTGGYRCDCRDAYEFDGDSCKHKCNIPNYCGENGVCQRSPFKCTCSEGYSGERCTIRPAASSQSDDEVETLVIAVVSTVCGLLFLLLFIVCLCVLAKRRAAPSSSKSTRSSPDIDDRASMGIRSGKGYNDYPTFAVNPAFSSRPPSVFGTSMGQGLNGQGTKVYSNDIYFPDDNEDFSVYKP
ncbi:hypothetical protein EGW08_001238, partial [Elysia chlorotica]